MQGECVRVSGSAQPDLITDELVMSWNKLSSALLCWITHVTLISCVFSNIYTFPLTFIAG